MIAALVFASGVGMLVFTVSTNPIVYNWVVRIFNKKTVDDRVQQFGGKVDAALAPLFRAAGVSYPPGHVTLLFIKDQKKLFLYAGQSEHDTKFIKVYEVLAASGKPGPKLKNGDYQVPEGVYGVESLNPNSLYHLSLRLDYPNEFDRKMAAADGREDLGTDIMIHGNQVSIGCVAIGDAAIEEVFVLAARVGHSHVRVVMAPTDLRMRAREVLVTDPAWVNDLDYKLLREFLVLF